MLIFAIVLSSISVWLAAARYGYRSLVQRESFKSIRYVGGRPTQCVDYMKTWHSYSNPCPKCAERSWEDFAAEKRQRVSAALALGPIMFIALGVLGIVTGKQPVSRSEQAFRLAQAEKDLDAANAKIEQLRAGNDD